MNRTELILALLDDDDRPPVASAAPASVDPWHDWLDCNVIIRTVTMTLTGNLAAIGPDTLALKAAAWVADSGRWATALETGELAEVEPFPHRVLVGRGAVVDATLWAHDLPRVQR